MCAMCAMCAKPGPLPPGPPPLELLPLELLPLLHPRHLPGARSGSKGPQQSLSSGDWLSNWALTEVKRASRSSTEVSSGNTATRWQF